MKGWCGVGASGRIVAVLLLVIGLSAAGCTGPRRPPATPTTTQAAPASSPGDQGTVVALLADNQLLAVAAKDGTILARHRLGPKPRVLGSSHAMALSWDRSIFYVLVSRGEGQPTMADRLELLDPATLRVRASYRLDPATTYRSLAVGPRSGRLYLFGNRADGTGMAAMVATLDPQVGRILGRWTIRRAKGRHWQVYRGAATSDERRLLVSYPRARHHRRRHAHPGRPTAGPLSGRLGSRSWLPARRQRRPHRHRQASAGHDR